MMRRVLPTGRAIPLAALARFGSTKSKASTVDDAVYLIPDNCTLTVGGFVAQSCPEYVLEALGNRFKETASPKNMTLVFGGGPGDWATKGLNHLAQTGMVKRTVGAHYGQVPMLAQMALDNAIEAYCLPMGSTSRMIRAAAAKQPGHITSVGFGTLVDPANGGGKLNKRTTEDLVEVVELLGTKYLLYKAIPIDAAIVRGTTGDEDGNITMERESLLLDHMVQAMAARSRRGVVIAEVQDVVAARTLRPRDVKIPGTLVDCVVASPPAYHSMSFFKVSDRSWTGETRINTTKGGADFPLDERKVVARRAALEIQPNHVINLGIGMPEGVALVANEEHIIDYVELTTEPGVHGGVGASGHNFGPATNPDAFLEMNEQFDFYNGGGLDICFLGNAETDAKGNVNVTRVGKKLTGPGGFIDISQCTKRVNLLGTFTAGGLEIEVKDGKLKIVQEGKVKKFVKSVKETTFSGPNAVSNGQIVHYITERCVFALGPQGIELVEIAPGVDLQRDILNQMEFTPIIRQPAPALMDPAIFQDGLMKLRERHFVISMADRVHYAPDANELYINLSNCQIASPATIEEVDQAIRGKVQSVRLAAGNPTLKVNAVACYDGYAVETSLSEKVAAAMKLREAELYASTRRYTLRAFASRKTQSSLDIRCAVDAATGTIGLEAAVLHCRALGHMVSKAEVASLTGQAEAGITLPQLEALVEALKVAHK